MRLQIFSSFIKIKKFKYVPIFCNHCSHLIKFLAIVSILIKWTKSSGFLQLKIFKQDVKNVFPKIFWKRSFFNYLLHRLLYRITPQNYFKPSDNAIGGENFIDETLSTCRCKTTRLVGFNARIASQFSSNGELRKAHEGVNQKCNTQVASRSGCSSLNE